MTAFQVHPADNVATLLNDAAKGERIRVIGTAENPHITLPESIALGHKVATMPIPVGASVIKYGAVVGLATHPIAVGEWVHLHNCKSLLDARTNAFKMPATTASEVPDEAA